MQQVSSGARDVAPAPVFRGVVWHAFTTRFLEERFGRRMHSYRAIEETSEIYWKDELVYEKTLLMCRSNRHVVEMAQRHPGLRVVSGAGLAARLEAAARDESMVTPMAEYAREVTESGDLQRICNLLRERDVVRLADATTRRSSLWTEARLRERIQRRGVV